MGKALWRKAQAVWGTRNPGLAREALDALMKVDPENPAAISMLREIEVEEARRRKKRTGVNIKPTFRFPNTSNPAGRAAHGEEAQAAEQEEDGDEDGEEHEEDAQDFGENEGFREAAR